MNLATESKPVIKPEWHCVAFDDTRYFDIEEEDKPYIEKILTVYFFDSNEYTYCCELTPSYYLRFLNHVAYCNSDIPEDVRDRINERYELIQCEDAYMYVSVVSRKETIVFDGEATEDEVREYWQGNPVY